MKKLILPMLVAGVLAGCASFPDDYEKPVTPADVIAQKADTWSTTPPVTHVPSSMGVVVRKYGELPAHVANQPLRLRLPAEVALSDVFFGLQTQGFKVISRLGEDPKVVPMDFNGSLGEFLDTLTSANNIAYEYRNGTVYLVKANRFTVALPPHKELMTAVADALKEMGAESIQSDLRAGRVAFEAAPDKADYIAEYLDTISRNAAMVTLQVAVLTVKLTRDYQLGFDWSAFSTQFGNKARAPGLQMIEVPTSTAASTSTGTSGGAAEEPAKEAIKQGVLTGLSGATGFAYSFLNDKFSLDLALRALSTFGDARTDQNVVLGTLSGVAVKIKSGNEIPYVESIGDRTNDSGNVTGGTTKTAKVETGLEVGLTPLFESADRTIVTNLKVDLASLVAFREFSAGNQLGTISLPEIQKLTFENLSRLQAGETLVVGGLSYDQYTKDYTSFPGLEKSQAGSEAKKSSRHAIFIAVRPTVVLFTREGMASPGVPSPLGAAPNMLPPMPPPVVPPVTALTPDQAQPTPGGAQ